MTSPLTDPELRAAEEAFERDCPKVYEMAELERERDWAHPQYSATALRDVYMLGYASALRASPMREAERAVVEACVKEHMAKRELARCAAWCAALLTIREAGAEVNRLGFGRVAVVEALLALRADAARGSEPAGEPVVK